MATLFAALRSLVWMTLFFWAWTLVALASRRFDPALGGRLPAWTPFVGAPLVAAGGALGLACVALFVVRGGGTPAPFDAPPRFVASGPYRFVRNPMYVGAFALWIGFALIVRSPAMLVSVALPAVLAHAFVRGVEEPRLAARFGDGYRAYAAVVPRWRPRLTPWHGPAADGPGHGASPARPPAGS